MATPTLTSTKPEVDPVHNWRLECLSKSGYPRCEALELSELTDIDLHLAVRLIEQGCDAATALRILL